MSGKSEKQRMLAGELYLAADPELAAARKRARRLCRLFNQTTEEEARRRQELLSELFGALGPGAEIEPPFYCDYGSNVVAGKGLYVNFGCVFLDCNRITIGDNVLFAPYVQVYAAYHPTDPRVRATGRELAAPVTIGNNVWIGGGAIICPGVSIGDDCSIGAGSVVTRDVPPGVVAAGNPCRVIRKLTVESDEKGPRP